MAELPSDVGLLDIDETDVPDDTPRERPPPQPPSVSTFRKIGSGMVVMLALVGVPYLVPGLEFARAWTPGEPVPFWNVVGREVLGEGQAVEVAQEEVAQAEALAESLAAREEQPETEPLPDRPTVAPPPDPKASLPPYTPHPDDAEAVTQSLELPDEHALDPFFEALARTEAGYEGAITRATHWGDSVVGNDNVTSALRFEMQRRFGDAGHGYHLVARPNASYKHRGIRFWGGDTWSRGYIIMNKVRDGHYGLGGTTVWSSGGAESAWATEKELAFGQRWSRIELWYAAQPRGGNVRLTVDDGEPIVVSTAADALEDRWHVVEVEDGPHAVEVRAAGGGQVRLHGMVFEREGPGVVWDGMSQIGAFTSRMLNFDVEHLRGQIDHRDPDLLVLMFGGNDLLLSASRLDEYAADYREVLARFRGTDDPRPCLVISPVDHGMHDGGRIVTVPMVPKLVQTQREVAAEAGCAFFDTFAAMGGEGSAGRWRRASKPLIAGDLAHLTHAGQQVIGHFVYLALMQRYVEYRLRTSPPPP